MTMYGLGTYGAIGGTYGGGVPTGPVEHTSTTIAAQAVTAVGVEATSSTTMPGG